MKRMILILMVMLLFGCEQEAQVQDVEIAKSVSVITLTAKSYENNEVYVGHVKSSGILKQAFEVEGKIEAVHVEVGDQVKKGDLLASIDTQGLTYGLNAANAELSAARAQYVKATESRSYAKILYMDTKKLYEAGVASKAEYDKVKLNYDVAASEVSSAGELVRQASTNVDVKSYLLDQSQMFATKDGIVVDVLNEPGELVASGYPIVVIRDDLPVVSFGIAQEDLKYIQLKDVLTLSFDEKNYQGDILSINQVPDHVTQTYEVTVQLEKDMPLGAILTVEIPTESFEGVKIPLGAVRSDGEDFVFVVEGDRVKRLSIDVVAIFNQEVVVKGIEDGAILVVEGIMGLTTGDLIKIVEDAS